MDVADGRSPPGAGPRDAANLAQQGGDPFVFVKLKLSNRLTNRPGALFVFSVKPPHAPVPIVLVASFLFLAATTCGGKVSGT